MSLSFFLRIFSLGTLLCIVPFVQANPLEKKKPPYFKDCPQRARADKDCPIEIGPYQIRVWRDHIFYQSPGERLQEDMPLKGEKIEWDEMKGQVVGKQAFLSFVLWSEPVGDGEIETATLYYYEIGKSSVTKKLEKVIGRRKRIMTVVGDKTVHKKFERDPRLKYRIFLDGQKVRWEVGKEKGILK